MSCLFSDDIAVGAVARDTLAIGVTAYSRHPSRAHTRRGEGVKKVSPYNYISFLPSRNTAERFYTKIAAGPHLHKYGTVARTYIRAEGIKSHARKVRIMAAPPRI